MTLVDANILLYAHNADDPQHKAAAKWLVELFKSAEIIALPWVILWAFIRISTSSRIWQNPLSGAQAISIVNGWLAMPGVIALDPGPRHAEILEKLVVQNGAGGALVTDAVVAALAIENGATVASTDQDFRRFTGLRWINPLAK